MTEPDEESPLKPDPQAAPPEAPPQATPKTTDNINDQIEGANGAPAADAEPEVIAAPEAIAALAAPSADDDLVVIETAPTSVNVDIGISPEHVVAFWRDAGQARWFKKDDAFDRDIRTRFETLHHTAARGELEDWAHEPEGALALLLLLDQFPRNLYRGSAHSFATDPLARQIAGRAIERAFDHAVAPELRVFFYLPFEHSEDARDQEHAVVLMSGMDDDDLIHWAQLHADIIARFGRFPHRNACLGRVTTDAEKRFLSEGGFSG